MVQIIVIIEPVKVAGLPMRAIRSRNCGRRPRNIGRRVILRKGMRAGGVAPSLEHRRQVVAESIVIEGAKA
jgi:uncharacterized protein with von Willebrand factor type A (vWA) domain